jgi:hypothetical protein
LKSAQIVKKGYPGVRIVVMSAEDPAVLAVLARSAGFSHAIPKFELVETHLPILAVLRRELEKEARC